MKFLNRCAFVALATLALTACSGHQGKQESKAAGTGADSAATLAGIRYIDADSLASQYNLAKDLNEAFLRSQENFENVGKQRAKEIENMERTINSKAQNNQYLNQQAYEADMKKYQQMAQAAQKQMADMEAKIQDEQLQNIIQLNDSIDNYLKILCKEKGYQVVLKKDATFYIDPKYDITDEVVKGLNARYVKVKK